MAHYFDAAAGDWVCGVCKRCTDHCTCEVKADIDHSIERCKREILADIASGRVPADVADFAELHDYVDANCYGGACEDDEDGFSWVDGDEEQRQAVMDYWNDVQNAVDAWLRAGRPMANRTDYPPDRK